MLGDLGGRKGAPPAENVSDRRADGLARLRLVACLRLALSIRWHGSRQRESDPYKSRIRQAAKFGWKQTVEVPEDGFGAAWTQRSMRFVRGNEEAVLWHKDATITLVGVDAPLNFDDFVDVEKWIKANPIAAEADHFWRLGHSIRNSLWGSSNSIKLAMTRKKIHV
jgi:hypothetical protein